MKLLILSQDYPTQNSQYAMTYVHTRSLYYKKYGTKVDVICFNCKKAYLIDGIKVHPPTAIKRLLKQHYEGVIAHAPNLRNHLRMLLLNFFKLPKIFFIFHGHEILIKSHYYPQGNKWLVNAYDYIKCLIWHFIIKKYGGSKIHLIFVSKYLKELALENLKLKKSEIDDFSTVIHNPLSPEILKAAYKKSANTIGDFITIRPLNQPVYALDILAEIAKRNPQHYFHIYGKGELPKSLKLPKNVRVFNQYFSHKELPSLFNKYRAGIMLSLHDTQGVMACDMAAYALPLIASDIPATREMFGELSSVVLIANNGYNVNLDQVFKKIKQPRVNILKKKLCPEQTALKELQYIEVVIRDQR